MKKPMVVLLHIAYWLIYGLLLTVIFIGMQPHLGIQMGLDALFLRHPVGLMTTLPNVLAFYGLYFWVFPVFFARKRFLMAVVSGFGVCVASAMCSVFLLFLIRFNQMGTINIFVEAAGMTAWLTLVAMVHGGMAVLIRGFIAWFQDIQVKEELNRRNFDTELALVKAQLEPHFLFNTLNNIDTLIEMDAPRASDYLKKLSDIMRFMLYETRSDHILLHDEIAYLTKYIELQKIRSSNPDFVRFEVNGCADWIRVAPLIFIPFVENAFKHSPHLKTGNAIDIQLKTSEKKILFHCRNHYQTHGDPKWKSGGIGNGLIARRLELLYPQKHTLSAIADGEKYEVMLTIELH
jgi:two-component system, LytTR family, sensor kinase